MLQQTQIATVLGKNYYSRFLHAFPDVHALAQAGDAPLLKAWEGLGYYRRARMLRETAREVISRHGGEFPSGLTELLELPGIGRYTAGALRAFAFGLPAVLVDGNVSRVLARMMDFDSPVDSPPGLRQIWDWAATLADDRRPRAYHAALMELGQTICRPGMPDCQSCPIAAYCRCRKPQELPVKTRKVAVTPITEHAIWLRDPHGNVLLHHESGSRRTGLWKLPLRPQADLRQLPVIAEESYSITRYRVTLHVHDARAGNSRITLGPGDAWVTMEDLPGLAMAAPFRRVIHRLLQDF